MENWKEERIIQLKAFMKHNDFIILRGAKSWNFDSDIDVLCPTYNQKEIFKRYIFKDVKLDVFKLYCIKKINVNYNTLLFYKKKDSNEISENIEAILYFLKDYIHFTRYRRNKHLFYNKPENIKPFLKEINCPEIMQYFLTPSSNIISFFMRSIIVKIIYYTTI